MGTRHSRNRNRMSSDDEHIENDSTDDDESIDLLTILSLIRQRGRQNLERLRPHDEPYVVPEIDINPDTRKLENSKIKLDLQKNTGQHGHRNGIRNFVPLLHMRELSYSHNRSLSYGQQQGLSSHFLPNHQEVLANYHHKVFCGQYSKNGNAFVSACQDQFLRVYDTSGRRFKLKKRAKARDMGWSIIDIDFSPGGDSVVYSTWSEAVFRMRIHNNSDRHDALQLLPEDSRGRFCVFSVAHSSSGNELICGASDGDIFVFDLETDRRTQKIDAHEDDLSSVVFADSSSDVLLSGGDDGLIKVWDRRALSETYPCPVGVLAGHKDGVTSIDAKGDGCYLVSNSKDQTIKLWDMRKFAAEDAQNATRAAVANQRWDYRWQPCPQRNIRDKNRLQGDCSVMTYRGHTVLNTLIRSYFSPMFSTGQRYIITGCAIGRILIYDVLTGHVAHQLIGHRGCVRDVAWHPYEQNILSSSWDSTVGRWTYHSPDEDNKERLRRLSDDEEGDFDLPPRLVRPRRSPIRLRRMGLSDDSD